MGTEDERCEDLYWATDGTNGAPTLGEFIRTAPGAAIISLMRDANRVGMLLDAGQGALGLDREEVKISLLFLAVRGLRDMPIEQFIDAVRAVRELSDRSDDPDVRTAEQVVGNRMEA